MSKTNTQRRQSRARDKTRAAALSAVAPVMPSQSPAAIADQAFQRAASLHARGKLDAAVAAYRQVIAIKADSAEAHSNLGVALSQLGRLDEAAAAYRRAIALAPGLAVAHFNLGTVLRDQGRYTEAVYSLTAAIHRDPKYTAAYINLGLTYSKARCPEKSVWAFQRAIELQPDNARIHLCLGNQLRKLGRADEAIAALEQSVRLQPNHAEAYSDLGMAYRDMGRHDEAIAAFNRAIEIRPGYANAHCNLGVSLIGERRFDEATAAFDRAVELNPDDTSVHVSLGQSLLARGDYELGWPKFDLRRNLASTPDSLPQVPQWRDESLDGDVIALCCEQGFGDIFQFVRHAPMVKARGGHVLLFCSQAMMPILSSVDGIDRIVTWGQSYPPCKYQVGLMSLPAIFGTTLETIPSDIPYVHADESLVHLWRERLSAITGFRVGIVWSGSKQFTSDPPRYRSIPLRCFEPLSRIPGVSLISLQVGRGLEELREVDFPIVDLGEDLTATPGAFMDAAAVVANLDLVITCDTGFCHFAGALGARTWTALPYWACWRWLLDREDSPWYPTMRLFRQTAPGEWDEVFERMAGAMRDVVLGSVTK